MPKDLRLLLKVWAEACRHIEIGESAATIGAILAQRLPVQRVLIRRLDPTQSSIETVAEYAPHAGAPPLEGRTRCSAPILRRISESACARRVWTWLPGCHPPGAEPEIPDGLDTSALVGGLWTPSGPLGVILFVAARGKRFTAAHRAIVGSLLEPFSVALENDTRLRELRTLREAAEADKRSLLTRLGRQDLSDDVVGAASGLRHVMDRVELVARSDVPVLILGETGVGKEVVARAIRNRSPRRTTAFVRVNCGSIPAELIDSELFGHERGSFTGAVGERKGWFERADGGTLFLDEVGELSLAAQVRLLHVLQDGVFERVGGERQVHVSVRIVAATARDLPAMVRDGSFREDLWYRLAVFPILVPPLRDRRDDIPALSAHFAERAARRFGLPLCLPTAQDVERLGVYSWPGNIRELASVIDRAAILGKGHGLEIAVALGGPGPERHPPTKVPDVVSSTGTDRATPLSVAIRRHIESVLHGTKGRIEGPYGAARILSINPHTLRARMRKLGISWASFREG